MQTVILAAGRGKRLHPVTANRTKAMAPIMGQPVIMRVMQPLMRQGLRDFIIVTSPEDDELPAYFNTLQISGLNVRLVIQPQPLGMGHALMQAAPWIHGDFILSSCDNLVPEPDLERLLALWRKETPLNAILTALPVAPQDLVRMGVLKLEGAWVTQIVEKPSLENAPSKIGSIPLYIFSAKLLEYLIQIQPSVRGEYELQDAIQEMITNEGRVRALLFDRRIDLTTPEDLLKINLQYLSKDRPHVNLAEQVESGTRLIDPIYIQAGVRIGKDCQIGPNVFIESGSQIGDAVRLENCVVLRDRIVPAATQASEKVIW